MRETPPRRDQREIVVPGDRRGGPAAPRTPRRPAALRGTVPGGGGAFAAFAGRAGRLCLRHPGGLLGTVAGLGAAAYVCLNAVGFQDGRHPAPILPSVAPKPVAARPAPEARAAEARPSERPPVREIARETAPAAPRDAIADLIRSGETTASVTPRAEPKAGTPRPAAAKVEPVKTDPHKADPNVARAQRALAKLGYGPIKDDGLMGPGTRAALERFERDRKLPVKGEATGRTLRELTVKPAPPQG